MQLYYLIISKSFKVCSCTKIWSYIIYSFILEVSGDSEETNVTVSAEAKLDANTSEFGSNEVQEILETKGMHAYIHIYIS